MTARARTAAVVGLVGLALAFMAGQLAVIASANATRAPSIPLVLVSMAGVLLWSITGALIVTRAQNRIGWIFLTLAALVAVGTFGQDYVAASHATSPVPELPATGVAGLMSNVGLSVAALLLPLVFLLFPTGTPPGRRWRWVARLWAVGAATSGVWLLLRPGDVGGCQDPECPVLFAVTNPLGLPLPDPVLWALLTLGTAAVLAAAALSIASLAVRFRRAGPLERQQIKWLMLVGVLLVVVFVSMLVLQVMLPDDFDARQLDWLWIFFVLLIVVGIPVASAFAILRHRLYDIDVVISKTIVFAGLALGIGAAYVAIVVGVGRAIGAGTDNSLLQIGATAAIALTFQPVRDRLQGLANRVVYGQRATPYEVMASFGARAAAAPSAEVVLGDTAAAAREGVGGLAAAVTVRLDAGTRTITRPQGPEPVGLAYETEVSYAGDPIGSLRVVKAAGDPLRPQERALLDDLASHAGLAFHNVRLTAELEARADELVERTDELRRSRERIVSARDAERRRLERELREGVGAELAGIRAEIEADADLMRRRPDDAAASLERLGGRANDALETLRDVARGIFPPLLADRGLVSAVEAHVRKLDIHVSIEIDGELATMRLDPETENAAYFFLVQALQNVTRHAPGAPAAVHMATHEDRLELEVADAGRGFDAGSIVEGEGLQIMRDRIAAVGGHLAFESSPGRGTTVSASIDARAPESVA